ncbi:hypothetical protein RB653_005487 [Dictyostelium firmibasis]|uniref:Mannosyl-oligosaccharide glucosidase n=1 Tax=Dictyostelium firmibasis TaxID=79012 RepID=A0AAN7U7F5_9MYCE
MKKINIITSSLLLLILITFSSLIKSDEKVEETESLLLEKIPIGLNGLNDTLYWGTYRPHTYFGMKTRSTKPINTGLIWSTPNIGMGSYNKFHYKVVQGGDNGIKSYTWTKHDGKNFGSQEITDVGGHLNLTTSFIKNSGSKGGDWSVRISAKSNYTNKGEVPLVSLIYYIHDESIKKSSNGLNINIADNNSNNNNNNNNIHIKGEHPEIGKYTLHFKDIKTSNSNNNNNNNCLEEMIKEEYNLINSQKDLCDWRFYGSSNYDSNKNWNVFNNIFDQDFNQHNEAVFRAWNTERFKGFIPTLPNKLKENSNVIAVQRVLTVPFNIEISFVSHEFHNKKELTEQQVDEIVKSILTGSEFDSTFSKFEKQFDDKFNKKFLGEKLKKHKSEIYKVTKESLSNLLGGFGYWYGSGITKKSEKIIKSKPVALFSATPSRPAFPRGFLWDEGFHQLLTSTFDVELTIESLSHWLNIMDENGWIPREQILGLEAASMVPEEFRLQLPNIANPPSIILVINKLLEISQAYKERTTHRKTEDDDYDGVEKLKMSMMRDLSIIIENNKEYDSIQRFLHSALPRLERFYQYYWNTQSSNLVENSFRWRGRKINHTLASGLDDYPRASQPSTSEIHIDLNSWVAFFAKSLSNLTKYLGGNVEQQEKSQMYFKQFKLIQSNIEQMHWDEKESLFHDILIHKNGSKEFLRTYGYMNYFPMLLGVLDVDSSMISPLLTTIKDVNGIWSRWGIRSMSVKDKNFGTHENYWKGPIWININYLFVHSMNKIYMNTPSIGECYQTLRFNLINNIGNVYSETGCLYEQYDPVSGNGLRNHPFSGWTSLVSLIASEQF